MAMELFLNVADIRIQHVPYRGVLTVGDDILGGQLSGMMLNMLHAQSRMSRPASFACSASPALVRSDAMPDIPTIAESGLPGFEALQWFGLLAPGGTPAPILNKLQTLILEAMSTPEMKERLKTDGAMQIGQHAGPVCDPDQRRNRQVDQARQGDQPATAIEQLLMSRLYPRSFPSGQ